MIKKSLQNNISLSDIKKILTKYYNKKYIVIDKKYNVIRHPLGWIVKDDNCWILSTNRNFIEEKSVEAITDFTTINYIIRDLSQLIPDLEFDFGFYPVFNKDDIYVGCIFNEDIFNHMEENDMEYEISKNILESKAIIEFDEKQNDIKEKEKLKKC